jgi:hypothetical protein
MRGLNTDLDDTAYLTKEVLLLEQHLRTRYLPNHKALPIPIPTSSIQP